MKVIVAGGRNFQDYEVVKKAIEESTYTITEVVCGCATGVDSLGERWANENNITISKFPADWNKHGRAAGPIRNQKMAEYAEGLIAVWDGESRGTKNMIMQGNNKHMDVFIYRV